ncbi:MBL fold metallo-hydrolase [Kiritimatiella glycovorans]|uniref:Metallo-hydrolase YycJ n=1 Tax=Kiritimatiella glycovorans TaxID=1307763 RepID=A0A0G3EG61_9BACT|nr:MBL fold metallo-hydrolase [Kiritimatiella glycovorans]AKJ65318.1 Putative metallo-hydrolase YycJ [Kiritimatiella glycovorans]
MALELSIIASGSTGNCLYVGTEQTRVLIDAGISGRRIVQGLEEAGIDPASIQALCVSHEHADHIQSVGVLHRRFGMDLFTNRGTLEGLGEHKVLPWNLFSTGHAFGIGDLVIEPFSVSHDAREPVGFTITSGATRIGIATDLGVATHLIRERLKQCRVIVCESNHDPLLLRNSQRPWHTKKRIAGRQGHLSNEAAAELISGVAGENDRLERVYLAHLSAECNRPEQAAKHMRRALDDAGHSRVAVELTAPDRPARVWREDETGRDRD